MAHESLCAVERNPNGPISLLRIADYDDRKASWQWLDGSRVSDDNADAKDSRVLSHSLISEALRNNRRDFVKVQWSLDQNDLRHPRVCIPESAPLLSYLDPQERIPLYNVIDSYARSLEDLQDKLMQGIRIEEHNLCPRILVLYQHDVEEQTFSAVMLDRDRLALKHGEATLRVLDAARSPLADRYVIAQSNIVSVRTNGRRLYLYRRPQLPGPLTKVPIYPFPVYIKRYVEWYCQKHELALNESDPHDLNALLDLALNSPEDLRHYAGMTTDQKRCEYLRQTLLDMRHAKHSPFEQLLKSALSGDPELRAACIAKLRENATELQQAEEHLRMRQAELGQMEEQKKLLQQEIDQANHTKEEIDEHLQSMGERLNTLHREYDEKRQEMNHIAPQQPGWATSPSWAVEPYALRMDSLTHNDNILTALINNLKCFGIKGLIDTMKQYRSLAFNMLCTLQCTRMLAIDSSFSTGIANAISIARHGKPASHLAIPADWHDASHVVSVCSAQDARVVVLDNLMDTANESMLFSLCRMDTDMIFILPVGSRRTLGLLATELWNHIFYVPTDDFLCGPGKDVKNFQHGDIVWKCEPVRLPLDEVSRERSEAGGIPAQAVALPLSIEAVMDDHADDSGASMGEDRSWTVPQRILQRRAVQSFDTIAAWLATQKSSECEAFLRTVTGISGE